MRNVFIFLPIRTQALRTLSLFPPQNRRASHFLALAATHDVRLFTLSLRELNAKSISVNLTVLYKISLDCAPDYLLCLKPIAYGVCLRLLLNFCCLLYNCPHFYFLNLLRRVCTKQQEVVNADGPRRPSPSPPGLQCTRILWVSSSSFLTVHT